MTDDLTVNDQIVLIAGELGQYSRSLGNLETVSYGIKNATIKIEYANCQAPFILNNPEIKDLVYKALKEHYLREQDKAISRLQKLIAK